MIIMRKRIQFNYKNDVSDDNDNNAGMMIKFIKLTMIGLLIKNI